LGLGFLLSPGAASAAAVEFYAAANKEELGLNETLTLTVTLAADMSSGETEDLRLPEAPDFEVVSRSQSQQMSLSMGTGGPPSFRKVHIYTIILSPQRTGSFTIRPGRLSLKGKVYETGALKVTVLPAQQAPHAQSPSKRRAPQPANPFGFPDRPFGNGEDADDMLRQFMGEGRPANDSDLYVHAALDRKEAFLGEQVTFSVYLFSRIDISGVEGLKMPKLDGFWAEEIESPQQISGETKMIDGVPYRVFLLRRRALFPIKSGTLTVDPVEVDVTTGFGLILSGRKVHRASQPLSLEVLPLPAGAPSGFQTPNVGQWRLSAEADPMVVQLGHPFTLKITLEGKGNLHDVVVPKLPQVQGLRSYDPTTSDKATIVKGRFGGKRTSEYLMMPEQTGSFEMPALEMTYFDPAERQYQTTSSQPLTVRVEAPAGAPQANGAASSTLPGAERALNVLGSGAIRPLRYKAELDRPSPPLYQRPFFLPLSAAPILLWLGLGLAGLARLALSNTQPEELKRRASRRARQRLKKAEAFLVSKDADAFYSEVSRTLHEYLSSRLDGPVGGLTRPDLLVRLLDAGVSPEIGRRLCATLDTCDAGRFAPEGAEHATMKRVHDDALSVMETLEVSR
jgi:hypothetical protein